MTAAHCVYCNQPLAAAQLRTGGAVQCVRCHRSSIVLALPCLFENPGAKPPPPPVDPPAEGEAACFYSPNRKATKECNHCGVLMSDIWSAQWGAQSICLKCLDHLREKTKDARFQTSRRLWDNITLLLALLPFTIFLYWIVPFSAPAALFVGIYHWNSPRSLVPRSRFRLVAGLFVAFAELAAIVLAIAGWWFGWYH